MNENLRKMRAALANYHKTALAAEKQIKQISEEMKPDLARVRIEEIRANVAAAKLTAIDQISAAAKKGKADAEEWGTLKPSDLTDDIKILQSGIRLSQKEYDILCKKYQNNGSMSRVLGEYADQRNRENKNGIDGLLLNIHLATVEKKAEPWNKLKLSAENIIENIDGYGFGRGADNPIVSQSVEQFGCTMGELYD